LRTATTTAAQAVAADRAAIVNAQTALNADKVAIDVAKLNLVYCLIKSPIDGRTGPVAVKEGNLIKANADTAMVSINQVRPIYVSFSVPEDQLPDVRRQMQQGALQVQAGILGSGSANTRGRLTFIDNTVDMTTGTIKLKATFSNEDSRLWPGQFVDVTLGLSVQKGVTVVPSEAIQNGPKGQFVYVVNKDKKADLRLISAGRAVQRMTVIDKGVTAGETVITDGQLRVVPGAMVQPVAAPGSGQAVNQ
jgi:multidrug efflux system membrane fusion protein